MTANKPSFKEKNRELQELVRELTIVRRHNHSAAKRGTQAELLRFAEGALLLIILERFLRILPEVKANKSDTLTSLFTRATRKGGPLRVPANDEKTILDRSKKIRNAHLHGNYEQAAQNANAKNSDEYFREHYSQEFDWMFDVVNDLMSQIDPNTGHRYDDLNPNQPELQRTKPN